MGAYKEKLGSIFFKRTKLQRTIFYLSVDSILLTLSLYFAFYLRFDGNIDPVYLNRFGSYLLVFLTVKLSMFVLFRLYKMNWTMVGLHELIDIAKAITVSFIILIGIIFLQGQINLFSGFPRSVVIIDFGISLVLITMFRASRRVLMHALNGRNHLDAKRVLIIGAGNAGEQIARDMSRQNTCPYVPVGFVDDDSMKVGDYIQGLKVLGKCQDIPQWVEKLNVETALIAIPSASSVNLRNIISYIRTAKIDDIKILPEFTRQINRSVTYSDIKEIKLKDIIGRDPISVDNSIVSSFIKGKKILITGAGGSIGSELVQQSISYKPAMIIALDIDETELYKLELALGESDVMIHTVVADVRDRHKVQTVFDEFLPDVVFHAAAYKHVPMMEKFPEEAVRVNINGTKNVAEAAVDSGTSDFILVSTDKAVNPTSIMGATKRVAEKIVSSLNSSKKTRFTSVRFGNVLGSRGSVIKTFEEQIRKGRPLTVTHAEMKRYFMNIHEACTLILQTAAMAYEGDIFHLDMGAQVKILDIAKELIRMNGLEPDIDIPIVISGIREGEKLSEELINNTEYSGQTDHPKILRVKNNTNNYDSVLHKIVHFDDIIKRKQWAGIRNLLVDLVPSYDISYNYLNNNGINTSQRVNAPSDIPTI